MDYNFAKYLEAYKTEEKNKFGSSQDEIIDKKLKEDNTKMNYFLAKEIFLRQHDDADLNKILNKNETSIKTMLISCTFGGTECSEDDFKSELIGEFHKCFKFNSDKNPVNIKNSSMNKRDSGLHLELYIGTQSDCKSPLSTTSGLIVYIHNQVRPKYQF
jgi:hypothetical protein